MQNLVIISHKFNMIWYNKLLHILIIIIISTIIITIIIINNYNPQIAITFNDIALLSIASTSKKNI